jgi:hypothetical protein
MQAILGITGTMMMPRRHGSFFFRPARLTALNRSRVANHMLPDQYHFMEVLKVDNTQQHWPGYVKASKPFPILVAVPLTMRAYRDRQLNANKNCRVV